MRHHAQHGVRVGQDGRERQHPREGAQARVATLRSHDPGTGGVEKKQGYCKVTAPHDDTSAQVRLAGRRFERYHCRHVRSTDFGLSKALGALSGRGHLTRTTSPTRCGSAAGAARSMSRLSVSRPSRGRRARRWGWRSPRPDPGQAFIKVVHENSSAHGQPAPASPAGAAPVVVLLAGLQGAGKTTTAGKLARWLIEKAEEKVLMASTDVYRRPHPAAADVAAQVGAGLPRATRAKRRWRSRRRALTEATLQAYEFCCSTGGRLHVDAGNDGGGPELEAEITTARAAVRRRQHAGQDAVTRQRLSRR